MAAVAVSVIFALQKFYLNKNDDTGSLDPASSTRQQVTESSKINASVDLAADGIDEKAAVVDSSTNLLVGNGLSEDVLAKEREAFFQRFDLITLGDKSLSDGDFNAVVAYVKNDPLLLEQLLQQYRENTQPERAKRLAQILGEFNDKSITAVAEELVFSGEFHSQQAGLVLLADQQVYDPQARELVSQVLETESNPQVLASALNALAKPGEATVEQTDRLLNQFVLHAANEDEYVRSHSISLMGRWAGDRNMNEHYLQGLSDSSEHVRRSAVFLLGSTKYPNDTVTRALREVLENSNESPRLRRNALASLKKHGLSQEEEAQYRERIAAGT